MLATNQRFYIHFTPTSATWLNMVEHFFREIVTGCQRCSAFTTVPELISSIDEYIARHNSNLKRCIWTKSAREILQDVIRANSRSSSKQRKAQRLRGAAMHSRLAPLKKTCEGKTP
jgi:hypothetical protein